MDAGVDPNVVWDVLWSTLLGILTGEYITLTPALWVFVGVLGAFVVTRTITRFIRRRGARDGQAAGPIKDITIGGVHVHHQVFGIVAMFVTGLIVITVQPTGSVLDVLAVLFGVGVGLAFDEFALWWHLDDVYWSEHGRKSIDAVAWVLVICASIRAVIDLLEVPADFLDAYAAVGEFDDGTAAALRWLLIGLVVLFVLPAVLSVLKGKLDTAALGLVYPPIGVVGAIRLAKPRSWWARRLYPVGGRRSARADRRFGEHYQGRWNRLRDLVGGAPTTAEGIGPDRADRRDGPADPR